MRAGARSFHWKMPGAMKINSLSETAVTITLGEVISPEMHREVMRLCSFLRESALEEMAEIVPGYSSVTVFVGVDFYRRHRSLKEYFSGICKQYVLQDKIDLPVSSRKVEIPVDYSGEDLEIVAGYCGLPVKEVVDIHSVTEYVVAMIGFRPGFPYLLGLDPRLTVPRRSTPRLRVPKGSVAIGGQQTGIYPGESPGGWHIIGYTTAELFDVNRTPPNLFQVGDTVKFRPA